MYLSQSVSDERLPTGVRLPAVVLLAAFLVAGAFTRQPHGVLASVAGSLVAVGFAFAGARPGGDIRLGALCLLTAATGVILDAGGTGSSIGHFGLCILAFLAIPTLGRSAGGAVDAALGGFVVYKLVHHGLQIGWLPWLGGLAISTLGGLLLARERSLLAQLRAAQADLAERATLAERSRIARDLHDVIAHSLTVSLLHVTAARLAVEHDPADAARALGEAERLGRASLEEVRSIVGMMRTGARGGGDDPGLAPTPGLDGFPELIERFRSAGVAISLDHGVAGAAVPQTIGTTAYRIAQEALTNAARHAPGAPVAVRIRAAEQQLELTVDSAGAPGSGVGSGLASMRERAEAVGGTLAAAPVQLDGGIRGWRVLAQLPTLGARWP